jgi:hypothetical protein
MKIEFYSVIEGIEYAYPPIPLTEVDMRWIEKSQDFLREQIKNKADPHNMNVAHLCSGIRGLFSVAYAIPAWHDFTIKTNGDEITFDWITTETSMKNKFGHADPIGFFHKDIYGEHAVLPPQTLKTIVKVPTPWRVKMPKGWGLMVLPMHYADENRFSSLIGVLDLETSNALHAVLYWHILEGDIQIKAGTPLFYVVPIKLDENYDYSVRSATEKEIKWESIREVVYRSVWKNGAAKVKSVYQKFWG